MRTIAVGNLRFVEVKGVVLVPAVVLVLAVELVPAVVLVPAVQIKGIVVVVVPTVQGGETPAVVLLRVTIEVQAIEEVVEVMVVVVAVVVVVVAVVVAVVAAVVVAVVVVAAAATRIAYLLVLLPTVVAENPVVLLQARVQAYAPIAAKETSCGFVETNELFRLLI
jgi:hypothetical protein